MRILLLFLVFFLVYNFIRSFIKIGKTVRAQQTRHASGEKDITAQSTIIEEPEKQKDNK